MRSLLDQVAAEVEGPILVRALVVLAPMFLLSGLSGSGAWLQAAIVTISAFISFERSCLAPAGVLLQGIAIIVGFSALTLALADTWLMVLGAMSLLGGAILLAGMGASLRSAGNFTAIPVLYLACEVGEGVAPGDLSAKALHFLPYITAALVPVLVMALVQRWLTQAGRDADAGPILRILSFPASAPLAGWQEAAVATALAVATAALLVAWGGLDHGQWVIWSAASVVTGDLPSARVKARERAVGALTGVPVGMALGLVMPHDAVGYDLAVLAAFLTLVAFRRYVLAFGMRCMFVALALVLAGQSMEIASERVVNVIAGGLIGILFVLAVHAVRGRTGRPATPG